MKRFVLLPLVATLLGTSPARAVAISAEQKPTKVHEDYVILHHDTSTKRVHVLFAARVAPAFRRVTIGLPTPTSPTLEPLGIDLPDVLHKLVAPHDMRLNKHPPAPPAPWTPNGARLDSFVEGADSAAHVFDAAWTKSYVDKGFFIAALGVTTPDDGRLEVMSPTVHISFESERLVLARREPPLPMQDESADVDLPDKPPLVMKISVSEIKPEQPGVSRERILRSLRNYSDELVGCYERFLERKPNAGANLSFKTTIRPKGDVVGIKEGKGANDPLTKELGTCVSGVLRAKQIASASEGYDFQSNIEFTPPRIPARRTHIVTIGSSRYIWRNLPASVKLGADFEILPDDLVRAMGPNVRKTLGMRDGERVWVSHWVDRSARRMQAEDVEFERQDLPARGEAGALPAEEKAADLDRPKPLTNGLAGQTLWRKGRNARLMLGLLVVSLAAALGIAWTEMRG